jgi:hypothetical protein
LISGVTQACASLSRRKSAIIHNGITLSVGIPSCVECEVPAAYEIGKRFRAVDPLLGVPSRAGASGPADASHTNAASHINYASHTIYAGRTNATGRTTRD